MKCLFFFTLLTTTLLLTHTSYAQNGFYLQSNEKLVKKNGFTGLKNKTANIPAEYDSLRGNYYYILAFKGNRADLYHRDYKLDIYLKDISPADTSFIYPFANLPYEKRVSLLYENGLWGWKTLRNPIIEVSPRYDSLKVIKASYYWYFKLYKNGKLALTDEDMNLKLPFSEYETDGMKIESVYQDYKIYTYTPDSGYKIWGLYRDSAHGIAVKYQYLYAENFPAAATHNGKDYYSWIKGIQFNGQVDYYEAISLNPIAPETVTALLKMNEKNSREAAEAKTREVENEKRIQQRNAAMLVFRNEKGGLGIISGSGEVVVPPGLKDIDLGYTYPSPGNPLAALTAGWKPAPGKHGLWLGETFFAGDTMRLFPNPDKARNPSVKFTEGKSYTLNLAEVPNGGYKKIIDFYKCSMCRNGIIPAHSYEVSETIVVAPAETITKTEKLVSKDLDKNGKFPTRTTTTYKEAVTEKRKHTVYEPEKTCVNCNGKGSIAEVIKWNEQLQKFDRSVYGSATRPE